MHHERNQCCIDAGARPQGEMPEQRRSVPPHISVRQKKARNSKGLRAKIENQQTLIRDEAMHRRSRLGAAALALLAGPALAVAASAGRTAHLTTAPAADTQAPMVIGLGLADSASSSRLTIELSDPVEFRSFLLTNPDRIVVDMPGLVWRPDSVPAPSGKGLVRNYRFGRFRQDDSRLVIELTHPARIASEEMLPPRDGAGFRLVVSLAPATAQDFTAHAGWPGQAKFAAKPEPADAVTRDDPHPLIVVDAGHGGMDPGTHGETGLLEKNVALSVARHLRDRLEQSGHYRVKLTRDGDVFIPLRERVEIARAAHGDLFVSLHADSNEHREVRGASVYTLSPGASDRESASLAEKENLSGVRLGLEAADANPVAGSILSDIGEREIMNLSARFAETVIAALPAATAVHTPLPHRAANFAVLKAADIPSVLIELGYLTNQDDESLMATEAWRSRVAASIAAAIDRHFSAAQVMQPSVAEAGAAPLSGHIRGVRTKTGHVAQELTQ